MFWFKKNKRKETLKEALNEPLDLGDVFSTINDRSRLSSTYQSICRIAHPDRYIGDSQKMAIAEQLFKDAQTHKTDLYKLTEIHQLAIKKLEGGKI